MNEEKIDDDGFVNDLALTKELLTIYYDSYARMNSEWSEWIKKVNSQLVESNGFFTILENTLDGRKRQALGSPDGMDSICFQTFEKWLEEEQKSAYPNQVLPDVVICRVDKVVMPFILREGD